MPVLTLKTVDGDRHVDFLPGESLREVLDSTNYRVRSGCRGTGACGLCRLQVNSDEPGDPTLAEHFHLSPDQIASGVRLACQVRPEGNLEVLILNPTPASSWKTITSASRGYVHFDAFPAISSPFELLEGSKHPYGVAVDLGTTHISLSLYDLSTGKWFTGRHGLNPQVEYGTDVMTRLMAACESRELAQAMRVQVIDAIGGALVDVATREGIGTEQVVKVVLVGNTAMLSLFSGRNANLLLQPAHWMSPIDCLPENSEELLQSWGIHPKAVIEILPPLAGFVGSDLLAGALATKLIDHGPGSLLIDFGTNSEIALWDGEALWVTSAAGGPAFEGCGISCGVPAESGAICRVLGRNGHEEGSENGRDFGETRGSFETGSAAHSPIHLSLAFDTIDGENPTGVCGSGIVDLIACLVESGKLTKTGRFAPDVPKDGIVFLDGGHKLILTRRDVDIFQRAKGAINAAVRELLSKARMRCADLRHVYVGGAFGHFLNRTNAIRIGLLPSVSSESIHLCGNTALAGCEYHLMSPDSVELLKKITARASIINLAQSTDFEDLFLEGLYLAPLTTTGGV